MAARHMGNAGPFSDDETDDADFVDCKNVSSFS